MSKITDIETTWKNAQKASQKKEIAYKIKENVVAIEDVSVMERYALNFSGNALRMLCKICEEPGFTKTEYANGSKTLFNEITVLLDNGLVEGIREPYEKHPNLYPTEQGKAVYTGLWYAQGKGVLVPKMQAADILIPFIFWDCKTYRLRYDQSSLYTLVDANTDKSFSISDLQITPDGDFWFSLTGNRDVRYHADVEEDFDLDDKRTRECLADIAKRSKEKHFEMASRNYDDLIHDFSMTDEEIEDEQREY